jgi:hypothetical protein
MKTEIIGDRELSAWLVAPGETWIQTRSPQFARKLSQRSDSHQVACGVAGVYQESTGVVLFPPTGEAAYG